MPDIDVSAFAPLHKYIIFTGFLYMMHLCLLPCICVYIALKVTRDGIGLIMKHTMKSSLQKLKWYLSYAKHHLNKKKEKFIAWGPIKLLHLIYNYILRARMLLFFKRKLKFTTCSHFVGWLLTWWPYSLGNWVQNVMHWGLNLIWMEEFNVDPWNSKNIFLVPGNKHANKLFYQASW